MKIIKMLILSVFLVTISAQCKSEYSEGEILRYGFVGWIIGGAGIYYTAKRVYDICKALEKYAKKEEINFREIPVFLFKSALSLYAIILGTAVLEDANQKLAALK